MATNITMPQLGESVTEGTITKWLVQPGDKVKKYDPLAEVMTDKVNAEVPSSYEGTIKELLVGEDETVEVGKVICTMNIAGEEANTTDTDNVEEEPIHESKDNGEMADTSNKKRYSPAVLKIAQEHGIDLDRVTGSGRGGRITRKDLIAIVDKGELPQQQEPATRNTTQTSNETVSTQSNFNHKTEQEVVASTTQPSVSSGRVEEIPVSGVRKAIANNMVKSKHEAPHAWMMIEVDVTDLVQFRNKKKEEFHKKEGIKLTFLPFFVKAAVEALKKFPEVNSQWAGDKIIRNKDVHISLAVATENELFVPVIKNADEKTIKGLAREINDLADKVRSNSLKQEDMQGGTFTVNNTGSFGSIQSQPIINYPQAAILSVESIVKRPVILENDAIAVRHMVNLCMSLDHRVLDGLICGRFLNHIKMNLENMNEANMSIY